jgi:hypothetical protein
MYYRYFTCCLHILCFIVEELELRAFTNMLASLVDNSLDIQLLVGYLLSRCDFPIMHK